MTEQVRNIAPRTAAHIDRASFDETPPIFRSVLFPSDPEESLAAKSPPECFVDLHLDQIVAGIVAKRDEEVLRPIFYTTFRDEDIIHHRLAVFGDLERPDVFSPFPEFCEAMQTVRENFAYAGKIDRKCHHGMVFLHAVSLYCEAVATLLERLQALTLQSDGLNSLRAYLADYTRS